MTTEKLSIKDQNQTGSPHRWSPLQDLLSSYKVGPDVACNQNPDGVMVAERAWLGKVALICSQESIHPVLQDNLGISLPLEPNSVSANNGIMTIWMSPQEWLLVTSPGREKELAKSLLEAVTEYHALVIDVSDRWNVISIGGKAALSILQKGTSARLDSEVFAVGKCCQTQLFSTPVTIVQKDEMPSFDIFVDSTFSEFLWQWIEYSADDIGFHVLGTIV